MRYTVRAVTTNKILEKMLDRLYASLATGPVLNCRPHSSRQRIDLAEVARVDGRTPGELLAALLEAREVKLVTKPSDEPTPEQTIVTKLRTIAEDARTYEQDTGAQVLYIGFPL